MIGGGRMINIVLISSIIALASAAPNSTLKDSSNSLNSLGDITTKLVSTLVEAEGEQVDIYGMANFVTSLSKAAAIVDHPNLYKELENAGIEEDLAKLVSSVKSLKQQQSAMEETIAVQNERLELIDEMMTELNHSKATIQSLKDQLQEENDNSDAGFVGFTAWADVSDYYSSGATIKFPRVLFNYGQGYDSYSGRFTCPFSGIYSVNAHVEERNSGGLMIQLMLDDEYFSKLHVHDDSTDHGTSASSAMVGCQRDQQIYVRTENSGSDAEMSNIEKRAIFSVYLVQRMPDAMVEAGNRLTPDN